MLFSLLSWYWVYFHFTLPSALEEETLGEKSVRDFARFILKFRQKEEKSKQKEEDFWWMKSWEIRWRKFEIKFDLTLEKLKE